MDIRVGKKFKFMGEDFIVVTDLRLCDSYCEVGYILESYETYKSQTHPELLVVDSDGESWQEAGDGYYHSLEEIESENTPKTSDKSVEERLSDLEAEIKQLKGE